MHIDSSTIFHYFFCFYFKFKSEGQTALHIASMNGDEYITRTLYKVRANPSLIDSEGKLIFYLIIYLNI